MDKYLKTKWNYDNKCFDIFATADEIEKHPKKFVYILMSNQDICKYMDFYSTVTIKNSA